MTTILIKEGMLYSLFCFEIQQLLIHECKKSSNLTHEFERICQNNLIPYCFSFKSLLAFGEDPTIDSLKNVLSTLPDSIKKAQVLLQISQEYENSSARGCNHLC